MSVWGHDKKYFDTWSFVHFLNGFLLGNLFYWIGLSPTMALGASVVAMILWEMFEAIINILESVTNVLIDILAGILGFIVSALIFYHFEVPFSPLVFFILLVFSLILTIWGFLDFIHRPPTSKP